MVDVLMPAVCGLVIGISAMGLAVLHFELKSARRCSREIDALTGKLKTATTAALDEYAKGFARGYWQGLGDKK